MNKNIFIAILFMAKLISEKEADLLKKKLDGIPDGWRGIVEDIEKVLNRKI